MKNKYANYYLLRIIIALFVISALLTSLSYSLAEEWYPRAIVNVHEDSYLCVRRGPGTEYEKTFLNLASKAIVAILETKDNWALVQFPKLVGVREPMGWVCMDYLKWR